MPLCIEDLPVELWLLIFSFLEGNDLKKAFSNLNAFFTKILHSSRIRLNVNTGGCQVLNSWGTSFCSEAFEALHANLFGSSDLLLFLNRIRTFPNLRSLSVHIRRQKNHDLLVSLLAELPTLEHLAVSCPMLNVNIGMVPLCSEIFKLSKLRICELRLTRTVVYEPTFDLHLPTSISLRHFHLDATISSQSFYRLVQFMPSLRVLTVYVYRHDLDGGIECSSSHLTKEKCAQFISEHVMIQNLVIIAPNLLYFYIYVEPYSRYYHLPFIEENIPLNLKKPKIHVRMVWKKNIISGMFDIVSPVIFQGREDDKEHWIVGQHARDYILFKTIPVVA